MSSAIHPPTPAGLEARFEELTKKYEEEAKKRLELRPEGNAQYLDLTTADSERLHSLSDDPWVDHAALNAQRPALKDGSYTKFLILGTGIGGLSYAIHLIKSGFRAEDIRFVDNAGGFGGAWYWNRFPGLRCDVESHCYFPFLEDTGYMPKDRFSLGSEILEYLNYLVKHWNLEGKALFRTDVTSTEWNDEARVWQTKMTESRGPGQEPRTIQVQSQYVLLASGPLTQPKAPKIPGLATFGGHIFHPARWDYSVTGGSPTDANLSKLAGKRVAYVGTGSTAMETVPALGRSASEVLVFQRTPALVYPRPNAPTDPADFKNRIAAGGPGWQVRRMKNYSSWPTTGYGEPPSENLVDDAFSKQVGFAVVLGCHACGPLPTDPTELAERTKRLQLLDVPFADGARARVEQVVKDKDTAERLKAWYPTYCKRPCFSDGYLDAFNLPNVKLVDTAGHGIEAVTPRGLVAGGEEHPVDVLIMGTGYRAPFVGNGSPAARAEMRIRGRKDLDLDDKWEARGPATLHGVATHGFPNLFYMGFAQAGASVSQSEALYHKTLHVVEIIAAAEKRAAGEEEKKKKAVAEVTEEAEEAWAGLILSHGGAMMGAMTCTPSYLVGEGEMAIKMKTATPEEMAKMGRGGPWGYGFRTFIEKLEEWRAEGSWQGVEFSAE